MSVEIRIGDALEQLRDMPDESVHCCVTSPPYWGLRDYGVDGQIGLEETPDEWCARLVEVFREVKRVLRDDGTCWVNVGDSYANNGCGGGSVFDAGRTDGRTSYEGDKARGREATKKSSIPSGHKPKDLIGQPWLLAFALRADGWYLRDAIVWNKPNPMPESVRDRCTNAYEHVFLLAKSKRYFFDAEAIRQPHAPKSFTVKTTPYKGDGDQDAGGRMNKWMGERNGRVLNPAGAHPRNVWTIATEPLSGVSIYGTYRIGSPDCSVHGSAEYLDRVLRCGELRVEDGAPRSLGIRGRPAVGQAGVAYAIQPDQLGSLSDADAAMRHSNQIRKMAASLERDGSCGDRSADCTENSEQLLHSGATFDRTPASNIVLDFSSDEQDFYPSAQTERHTLCIATFEDPPKDCSCQYIGKVEKRIDHFASFPTELARRCILAGTSSKGVCAECGAPWVRMVDIAYDKRCPSAGNDPRSRAEDKFAQANGTQGFRGNNLLKKTTTTGWQPTCKCDADVAQATVLDPFGGAGTTALVADRLQRNAILIELNAEYAAMASKRIDGDRGGLLDLFEMQAAPVQEAMALCF